MAKPADFTIIVYTLNLYHYINLWTILSGKKENYITAKSGSTISISTLGNKEPSSQHLLLNKQYPCFYIEGDHKLGSKVDQKEHR